MIWGVAKIPEPMVMPTKRAMPSKSPSDFFNFVTLQFLFLAEWQSIQADPTIIHYKYNILDRPDILKGVLSHKYQVCFFTHFDGARLISYT